ncbi:MAG: response regulator [Lyngbya sp. HA4199-MV5]|nr:response regulator [Lyngbya sp. HA4199-MV5]
MKILLVEDDQFLTELLVQALTEQNYLVETAADGQMGWDLAEAFQYDLILLDVVLPTLSGIHFCQQLRAQKNFTPVILLTSQDSSTHKVSGLDAGADDYVVKPFHLHELLARIRALRRRESLDRSPTLIWRGLQLNTSSCAVSYDGRHLSLTSKEYKLLELFLRHQQRIFSQSALINHLWSFEEAPSENGVRAHIKGLRRKLKQAGCEDLIETIYGLGYRLRKREVEDVEFKGPQLPDQPESDQPASLSSVATPQEFAGAWQHYRGHYRDRLAVISQAISALTHGSLSAALRQQAVREAHTLAGSLGSFGLDQASHDCKQLEARLTEIEGVAAIAPGTVAALSELVIAIEQTLETPLLASTTAALSPTPSPTQPPHLLIVSEAAHLIQQLMAEAIVRSLHATIASPTTLLTPFPQQHPDVVLLDLSVPETVEHGFACLEALATVQPPVPVVVLMHQGSFAERVKIARLGGRAVLQMPLAPEQILRAIVQVLPQTSQTEGKVLIVDDDPHLLQQLTALLQPWGFQVVLLDDPQRFWETLEQTQPDLLILDLVMPKFSGLDLCKVVRNDPQWDALPVIFLSANTDAALIHQVFLAGANDYASKPFLGAELLARILNQLKRVKPKP